MFVSTKDKFIFFHIAKTAGSSIHIALKDRYGLVGPERADPPPLIHHIGPEVYLSQHPEHSGYFKFAFVRNPFDRILSAYMEFIQMPHRTNYPLNIHKYNSFEVFCCSFATSAWCLDPHFKKQSELLYKDGNLLVNEVGKFENLQDNLNKICDLINIERIELTFKHRQTKHGFYRDYYTSDSRKAIEKYFEDDLKLFDYRF